MKLFGITGGIGMGKSVAGSLLAKQGMAVLDTDDLARKLVEPGQEALAEIAGLFGASVLLSDGCLDRQKLAGYVFADAAARAKLEAILHPKIHAAWQAEVEKWRVSGGKEGAVIIPLLYEIKAEKLFDAVICVACGAESQLARLRCRGWSEAEIRQRLDSQLSVNEKLTRADFVIWTDTTLEAHEAQLQKMRQTMTEAMARH
jgi:dephospho-CoA kinase